MIAASLVLVLLLLCAGEMLAQSEKKLAQKAAIKIKLKKYAQAAAILASARQKYPSSVEIAKLRVKLCEEAQAEPEEIINAYSELTRLLQLKEVRDGKLASKERRLLKKTEKKTIELLKIRGEVNAAVKEFVSKGTRVCGTLSRAAKHTEASFVFQRLRALKKDEESERELTNLAGELRDKAWLLKRPTGSFGGEDEQAGKLILKAQKLFKSGKFDKARLECKAALELDPDMAEARAILCDIAQKMNDTAQMLTQGLSYLLFPPQAQTAKRAEEIEKRVLKASPDLRAFFDNTAKAADKICKLTKKATREKRSVDVKYAMWQLTRITHRTKKVESLILKAEAIARGTRIFDGKSLSGWVPFAGGVATVTGGCMAFEFTSGYTNRAIYLRTSTSDSFALQFSFRAERLDPKSFPRGETGRPAILVSIWGDGLPSTDGRTIVIGIHNNVDVKRVELIRWSNAKDGWETIATAPFSGPLFESGKWYKVRIEYAHRKMGTCSIIMTVNGRAASQFHVPDDFFPERTGCVGVGQQLFKSVKFKDIYLAP